jgi:hypothetical protein
MTAPYKQALKDSSLRTRTPLPSLLLSFGVLHEITAIVPFVALFFASRRLALGESLVDRLSGPSGDGTEDWMIRDRMREWVQEGEAWVGRVGQRYGVFGFQKPSSRVSDDRVQGRIAGDVANAVFAYAVTKVLYATCRSWHLTKSNRRPFFLSESASRCISLPLFLGE